MNGTVKENGTETKNKDPKIEEDSLERDKRHSNRYWRGLQTFKPVRFDKQKLPAPVDNANFFSFMTFAWVTKYISKAKHSLKPEDVPPLSVYDATVRSTERLERLYKEDGEKHGGKPKIGRSVNQFIKTRMLGSIFFMLISMTATFIGPAFLINRLVSFADLTNPTVGYGIGLTVALGVSEFTRSLFFSMFFGMNYRTAIRARGAVLSIIFKKVARLRSLKDKSVGEIVNLISNDSQRIFDMIVFAGIVVGAPYMIALTTIFCCVFLGWTALIGVLTFLLFIPIQAMIGRKMADFRRKCVTITDSRVRMMNEILTCVKLIKMYAWENSFAKAIAKIRKKEQSILQKSGFIQSYQISIIAVVPVVSTVLTFIVHTLLGYPLDAASAFTIIAVFNSIRFLLSILPQAVKGIAEVFVSYKRIDDILSMEEIEEYYDEPRDQKNAVEFRDLTVAWDIVEKTGTNGNKDKQIEKSSKESNDEETVDVLFDINVEIPKKRLLGICGSVGSGKSSFISSLLGELRIHKGSIGLDGTMAYVPQQAWIFHASVRENILFGLPYDEEKYNRIIKACSLEMDFKILTDGDSTEVGERGINLSGGQKQRISLARAVYSNRDIVLLDDPLSAVDAHVGKHIFFECIKKELSDKTVIFVTHQLQYLKDCDEIILLKEGRIAEQGIHDKLIANNNDYAELIKMFYLEQEKENEKPDVVDTELVKKIIRQRTLSGGSNPVDSNEVKLELANIQSALASEKFVRSTSVIASTRASVRSVIHAEGGVPFDDNILDEEDEIETDGKAAVLIKGETASIGSVSGHTYYTYFQAAGGIFMSIITGLLIVLLVFGVNLNNWWLSVWINAGGQVTIVCPSYNDSMGSGELPTGTFQTTQGCVEYIDPNISTGDSLGFYQGVYGIILVCTIILGVLKAIKYTHSTIGAATTLHNKVFKSVFGSPMSFFDTTPTGRILNRFSRDLDDVDVRLVLIMDMFLLQICMVIFSIISMSLVFPYFLIAVVVIAIVFGFIYSYFRAAVREFKRLDNITRSPWFSHVTSTVQGLSTIHSYNKTDDVINTFNELLDANSSPTYLYYCVTRWLSVRLDLLTISTTLLVALFVVFSAVYPSVFGEVSSSFAGLALTYAIQLTGLFQVCVRFSVETASYFTSVERIVEYIDTCPSEANPEKAVAKPEPSWPEKGEIRFSEAGMRYRPNLPLVLKNLKFVIKPKEKVGIVGRTGSGKSSLGTALFRLVELDQGKTIIDDVDISDVSLKQLREKLSIIPQEPVLFVGNIRYNLDPFGQYSDTELWMALERTHMKAAISELPDKLESEVVENGENFSVGERQLLCMARAILRHSKIIMLDEATAAIDSETDSLVQDTIREAFSDCTMLTIAHRLNTVLTCDKILVMDDGKVAEYDDPAVLLSNPDSHFSKMINAAASNEDKQQDIQQQINVVNNNQIASTFDNLAFENEEESSNDEYEQTEL